MKIHIGSNIIFRVSEQYYILCNFLTIDFGENLHECIFVRNQFLFIKIINENAKILNSILYFSRFINLL